MEDDVGITMVGMLPPDTMTGPRAWIAWMILVSALGVASLGVKLLPRAHPTRVFVEGAVALILRGVTSTPARAHPVARGS